MSALVEVGAGLLRAGPLEVRPEEFSVSVAGKQVALTARELQLLVALMHRPGRIVSRLELYSVVWGRPYRREERSVDVYVRKLRAKLETAAPELRFIHTHFGFGYRLAPERASQLFHTPATDR